MMKTIIVALMMCLAAPIADAAKDLKIGTVDMQKALQTVNAGKNARSRLEKIFQKKKKELQKEEKAIVKMRDELQKQSLVMNQKKLSQKQGDLQRRIMEFQKKTAMSQADIQKREQELTRPIIESLKKIISGIAKEKGYTVILEKSQNTVLFSLEKDDLTKELIEKFNKKNKG